MDRAHAAPCRRPCRAWASTAARPPGSCVSSHSKLKRFEKKLLLHLVGVVRPRHLEAARDRVRALAAAEAVVPAEALRRDVAGLGLLAHIGGGTGAMRLAEGVAARDQRDGLFVVHRHAAERVADVPGGGNGVGLAVRTFGIDVDQAHLHGGERILEVTRVRHLAVVFRDSTPRAGHTRASPAYSEGRRRATCLRPPSTRRGPVPIHPRGRQRSRTS